MSNWQTELKCNKCNHILKIYQNNETMTCTNCKKEYSLITNQISYAVAESYSREFYCFKDSNTIYRRSFNNPPVDTLEEAYQDTKDLSPNENNPQPLLNIVKKYHDAIKMAARRLIELNPRNLNQNQKDKVQIDNLGNPEKSLNIKNLNHYLKCAFPQRQTDIDNCFNRNSNIIKKIWWVRNKMEHILYTQWPVNSKIFEDPNKNPDSSELSQDILNYDFVKKTNHAVIDIYQLILDLRPTQPQHRQIYINIFRIQ